jgi:hypothetical protein
VRLLCDENVKAAVSGLLEQEGHDVARVQDELEIRFDDEDIVAHCLERDRVVVTNDDFLEFADHGGILFVDDQRVPPRPVASTIKRIEGYVDGEELMGVVFHVPDGWV